MNIDPWILAFSAVTVVATIWMGFWSAKKSKTASDFFVAGRSVSVGWNASAISGEYLSAASFMGVAGMVMSSGYDALWYPVCYACGYLFLLLFIAGPLRRFGAYTIPDFAEGRFDSPVFRKIAVIFVLFIGFFYTMPQMKGAGTTLAYIFPGLPYWAGVVLVGVVITLNVALGGMKGITLVQAFQYWAKMFAISVPIFVLMAVYGYYGKQLQVIDPAKAERNSGPTSPFANATLTFKPAQAGRPSLAKPTFDDLAGWLAYAKREFAKTRAAPSPDPSSRFSMRFDNVDLETVLQFYGTLKGRIVLVANIRYPSIQYSYTATNPIPLGDVTRQFDSLLQTNGIQFIPVGDDLLVASTAEWTAMLTTYVKDFGFSQAKRRPLPEKAPADSTWLSPFGPLTTKAAKAAAAALTNSPVEAISLRADLSPDTKMTVNMSETNVAKALATYAELTGRTLLPRTESLTERIDAFFGGRLSRWHWVKPASPPANNIFVHGDGLFSAVQVKEHLESIFRTNGIAVVPEGSKYFQAVTGVAGSNQAVAQQKAWLATHEKPLALLYTYSLIIALVCGTAGLPHILVRFYTNPNGAAAKRTTMWVMILIGVFYLFPPIFGVMGRNLMPDLYNGLSGVKGTDGIVLKLPTILREKYGPLGSILSGVTCAGAFAAFMSTFSGLLVSMTGALAHDVYGRMLNPSSTPPQRLRAFRIFALGVGGMAILLGSRVEQLQINFMVGQAFAIAAASYFPLLFMSTWWRGMTSKGAATGMLTGGVCALAAVTLTNFSDLKWLPLDVFWAAHPLARILCEQPAIWTVPLAISLMILVSKAKRNEVPGDIRMKMLVLHAPEQLGLRQDYIQEHQHGH